VRGSEGGDEGVGDQQWTATHDHSFQPAAKLPADCCAQLTEWALAEDDAARLASVFAALADPARLRLLSVVASQGEVCTVGDASARSRNREAVANRLRHPAGFGSRQSLQMGGASPCRSSSIKSNPQRLYQPTFSCLCVSV
jgi:hypothetical protein